MRLNLITPLSKLTESTARVNSNVNYGRWVVMIFQCRLINCNKWTTLVEDIDNGGGESRGYMGILYTFCLILL